jgi:hypothetical protein
MLHRMAKRKRQRIDTLIDALVWMRRVARQSGEWQQTPNSGLNGRKRTKSSGDAPNLSLTLARLVKKH